MEKLIVSSVRGKVTKKCIEELYENYYKPFSDKKIADKDVMKTIEGDKIKVVALVNPKGYIYFMVSDDLKITGYLDTKYFESSLFLVSMKKLTKKETIDLLYREINKNLDR